MKICKKFEFPAIKNWDKFIHLLEKKISWFSLIGSHHRLLLLKSVAYSFSKQGMSHGGGRWQVGGGWVQWTCLDMPRGMQTSTTRWLRVCLSSFNNRSLWFCSTISDNLAQVFYLVRSRPFFSLFSSFKCTWLVIKFGYDGIRTAELECQK